MSSYLTASIHNLYLYLLTSLGSYWKAVCKNRHCCQERCDTPHQIKPNSVAKIQHSAEGGREAEIRVFPIKTQSAGQLYSTRLWRFSAINNVSYGIFNTWRFISEVTSTDAYHGYMCYMFLFIYFLLL